MVSALGILVIRGVTKKLNWWDVEQVRRWKVDWWDMVVVKQLGENERR